MYQGLLELRALAKEGRAADVIRIEELDATQGLLRLMRNRSQAHLLLDGGAYVSLKNWVLESGFYGEDGLKAFGHAVTHVTSLPVPQVQQSAVDDAVGGCFPAFFALDCCAQDVADEDYHEECVFIGDVLPSAVRIIGAFIGPRSFPELVTAIEGLGLTDGPVEPQLQCLSDAEARIPLVTARFAPWFQRDAVRLPSFAMRQQYCF
jgi:hypothetical protein